MCAAFVLVFCCCAVLGLFLLSSLSRCSYYVGFSSSFRFFSFLVWSVPSFSFFRRRVVPSSSCSSSFVCRCLLALAHQPGIFGAVFPILILWLIYSFTARVVRCRFPATKHERVRVRVRVRLRGVRACLRACVCVLGAGWRGAEGNALDKDAKGACEGQISGAYSRQVVHWRFRSYSLMRVRVGMLIPRSLLRWHVRRTPMTSLPWVT